MNRILIAALGNSDPYTESHKDKLGPTLTLLNEKSYSHIILFLSPEMHQTNRLELFKKILKYIYQEIHNWAMPQIIEENFNNNDIYEAEQCFINIKRSIQQNQDLLSKADEIICSKAAGTPQFKNIIEVISRIYYPNKAKILSVGFDGNKMPRNIDCEEIPAELISQENLVKNTERINSRNEATEILFLSKLQSLIELIKNYEYYASLSLLDSLCLEFKDEFSVTFLDDKKRKRLVDSLKVAKLLLSFDFQAYYGNKDLKSSLLKANPELASQLVLNGLIDKNKSLKLLYIALNNLYVLRQKKLNKDFVLNVVIFAERLLKNSLLELRKQYEKTELYEYVPMRFNSENEQKLQYLPKFKEFIQTLKLENNETIKQKLVSLGILNLNINPKFDPISDYLSRIDDVKESSYPNIIDIKYSYLYLKESPNGIFHDSNFFKIASILIDQHSSLYDGLTKKRNELAHNFKNISEKDFKLADELFEIIAELYQETYQVSDYNLHQRFSDYIIAIINRL